MSSSVKDSSIEPPHDGKYGDCNRQRYQCGDDKQDRQYQQDQHERGMR